MKGRQALLSHRLDRDAVDLVVTMRLEQCLGVGPIGLVPLHIGTDAMRG
jgi:hypothetical protein